MSHLDEQVSDLVDGRLDAAGLEQAERHLAGCRACRDVVEAERLTKARLVALAAPAPDDALLARLLAVPGLPSGGEVAHAGGATVTAARPPVDVPGGSRRPGERSRVASAPAVSRPPASSSRRRRVRFGAGLAGSLAVLGAGVFSLSVVSPSANAAMTPSANLVAARHVVTMVGFPVVTALPGWLANRQGSGR